MLIPLETVPPGEDPADWIRVGAYYEDSVAEMPLSSLVLMNRERELGLDRRETG